MYTHLALICRTAVGIIRDPRCVWTLTNAFVGDRMLLAQTSFRKVVLTSVLIISVCPAVGDDNSSTWPPAPASPAGPALGSANLQPVQPPSPYSAAWPPPGQDARTFAAGRQDWTAVPEHPAAVSVAPDTPPVERLITSTWYFRQDAFFWNERLDGRDFVNEYGPLSTLGYSHRNRFERFRVELFGGTVAYDGGAQFDDGSYEPYHQSNGTNYFGVRGEYDLLIEPACWSRVRAFVGIGTRFWMRDLQDAITPSGSPVSGYEENWWTFYPYIGLETKESDEPGWKFFGSARFGVTPLTIERINDFETTLHPKCGLTAQMEVGIRFQRLAGSACVETMTW